MYTGLAVRAGWRSPRSEYLLLDTKDKLVLGSTINITMDTISAINNIKTIDNIKTRLGIDMQKEEYWSNVNINYICNKQYLHMSIQCTVAG